MVMLAASVAHLTAGVVNLDRTGKQVNHIADGSVISTGKKDLLENAAASMVKSTGDRLVVMVKWTAKIVVTGVCGRTFLL